MKIPLTFFTYLIFCFILLGPTLSFSQKNVKNNKLQGIHFDSTSTKFGTIIEGEIITKSFTFKNNTRRPIEVINATASCGCTTPEFPFIPIAPNKEGTIKVTFNSNNKVGSQKAEVKVFFKSFPKPFRLYLIGNVFPKVKLSPLVNPNTN
jgi:hypothetical protein